MALRSAYCWIWRNCLGLRHARAQNASTKHANLARPNTPDPPDLYPIASDARLGSNAPHFALRGQAGLPLDHAVWCVAIMGVTIHVHDVRSAHVMQQNLTRPA